MTAFEDRLRAALAPTYDLGDELPGGGMSRVFVATDRALGRRVVVKVLPPELAAGVNRDRFRREIQLAASLQHPHIVPLLAAGEDAELLYYTMPFIEGESLRDRLARKDRLSVREVVRMLHDVVDALAYAHGRGVVHRDIKPGNILTQGSHALVTDFGVAKAISAALPGTGMTTTGMAIGTPAYMAPEQLAADPAADHRVDLYAVGLLAYELLAGSSPFASKSPTETMAAQFTREPPPLETIRDDVPPALGSLIRRLLSKTAADRPADAQQVLAALDDVPSLGGSGTPTQPVRARRSRRVRLAGWVALGVAALVAAGIGGAVAASRQIMTMFDGSGDSLALAATRPGFGTDTVVLGDSAPALVLTEPAPDEAPAGEERRLTRADSIAIAEAVRAELARAGRAQPQTPPPSGEAPGAAGERALEQQMEQLTARLHNRFVDSVLRTSMAEVSRTVPRIYEFRTVPGSPPAPPVARTPHTGARVFVGESLIVRGGRAATADAGARQVLVAAAHEDDPEIARLSTLATRAFRVMLGARPGHAAVSPGDAHAAVAESGDLNAAAVKLGAEVVTTVDLIGLPGDSVVMLIKLRDLTAAAPFSYRVAASGAVARMHFDEAMSRTLRSALEHIEAMAAAPRRE